MAAGQAESAWDVALNSLQPGIARCLFAPRVEDALDALQRSAAYRLQSPPLVLLTWPDAPRIDQALREIACQLAAVATAASPNWLGDAESHPAIGATTAAIDAKWYRQVKSLLRARKPPLPSGFPVGESVRRLAAAISPFPLTCLFVVEGDVNDRPVHLDGLCRCVQWVARQTGGRIALVLNESFRDAAEVASIDFQAITLTETGEANSAETGEANSASSEAPSQAVLPSVPLHPSTPCQPSSRDRGFSGSVEWDKATDRVGGERKLRLWPLLGQPHPFSPGEQLLAAALAAHQQLTGRFAFNELVETADGKRYIVDLLDPELKLVVEVDGYQHHSSQAAFAADRDRDFRLQVNGYRVLRLTHHEVVRDVCGALAKIDTLVRYCLGKANLPAESKA